MKNLNFTEMTSDPTLLTKHRQTQRIELRVHGHGLHQVFSAAKQNIHQRN